ncbi:unnamed protein product [Mucor hiemalis]
MVKIHRNVVPLHLSTVQHAFYHGTNIDHPEDKVMVLHFQQVVVPVFTSFESFNNRTYVYWNSKAYNVILETTPPSVPVPVPAAGNETFHAPTIVPRSAMVTFAADEGSADSDSSDFEFDFNLGNNIDDSNDAEFLGDAMDIDGSEDRHDVLRALETEYESFDFRNLDADPFRSLQDFVLISFIHGETMNLSGQEVKKMMVMINVIVEIMRKNPEAKLPATDYVLKYDQRKKSRVPKMATSEHAVENKNNEEHSFFLNKPSEYLKHLMAHPIKAPILTSFPDETQGEMTCMQQVEKWKTHRMFQNLMVSLKNGSDLWVGDLRKMSDGWTVMVDRFYKQKTPTSSASATSDEIFADCYLVLNAPTLSVSLNRFKFFLSLFSNSLPVDKRAYRSQYNFIDRFTFNDSGTVVGPVPPTSIDEANRVHKVWLNGGFRPAWKRIKRDGNLMKVVLAPLMLFSDDTSGNVSKQYNLFDSFLVIPAAMSYDARSSKNNCFFICTSNKKLSSMDMLPPIVDDLLTLENGVEMYSIVEKENVLVVAPLLLIQADNYRHSELSMHKGSTSTSFCRKCTIWNTPNPNPTLRRNASKKAREEHAAKGTKELGVIRHEHPLRTIEDLIRLRDTVDANVKCVLETNGFVLNGSEELLRLDSYDPTLDSPIELLHTLPLGVGKCLLKYLVVTVLTDAQTKLLQTALGSYKQCPAYARNFRALLNHNGSFLGRDFKQLTQILPVVLRNTFVVEPNDYIDLIAKCFETYGCLSSLVYMRNFTGDKNEFAARMKGFIDELTSNALALDNHCIRLKRKKAPTCLVSLQPKLHMLHHMVRDFGRFGLPVNYETGHGEQFNKLIREEVLRTNRHNPSRYLAVAFGRQFIIHHVVGGGFFLDEYHNADRNEKELRRVTSVSVKIEKLMIEQPKFFALLFDSRENADNNDFKENPRITLNTSGIFKSGDTVFFGVVTNVDKAKYTIQKFEKELFTAAFSLRYIIIVVIVAIA